MKTIEKKIFSGTSGLVLPVKQSLYPREFQGKSRLIYYASLFNSLEINSSFYKIPKASTVMKWAESVSAGFKFTFKLFKGVSHVKRLEFDPVELKLFMDTIGNIADKKGSLLIQLPPSSKIENIGQLQVLLKKIKNADPNSTWQIAIEFRNSTWYDEKVYELLRNNNVSLVIHDIPASTPPTIATADFMYLRFHGPGGRYRGTYTDEFLRQQAQSIKSWVKEGKSVYFYFNNTMGDAVQNLQTLNGMIFDR